MRHVDKLFKDLDTLMSEQDAPLLISLTITEWLSKAGSTDTLLTALKTRKLEYSLHTHYLTITFNDLKVNVFIPVGVVNGTRLKTTL